jgi:hypothetical protein
MSGGDTDDAWYDPLSFDQFVGIVIAGSIILVAVVLMVAAVFHSRSRKHSSVISHVVIDTERQLMSGDSRKPKLVQYDMHSGEASESAPGMALIPRNSVDDEGQPQTEGN